VGVVGVFLGASTSNEMSASRPRPAHGAGGRWPGTSKGFAPPGIPPLCQLVGCGWGAGMLHAGAGGRKLPFRALAVAMNWLCSGW
jgi:hypothetical protein